MFDKQAKINYYSKLTMQDRKLVDKIKESILNTFVGEFYRICIISKFRRNWRKINRHNETTVNTFFDINLVKVGFYSYGELNILTFDNKTKIIIGDYVSIAQNVVFIADAEHYTDHVTTFPMKVKIVKSDKMEAFTKGDIIVEDDVWIGYGASILSGVHIAQGAVIAAGAIVTKDVPPYAVVGGNPARIIKYRFSDEVIEELLKIDYSKLTKEMICEHIDDLYRPIENMKIDELKQLIHWFPKKY